MQYFGGKQKIAGYIASFINKREREREEIIYVEPFCGSCNVASKIHIKKKILNDKNPYLIAMFKALQNGWMPPIKISEEEYQLVKKNQDKEPHIAGFVGFACSFAGKFWGGYARDSKGGGKGNYALRGHNSILKKMKTLIDAEFTCKDFTEISFNNCIIYCDPPYKNTTPYYKKILGEFPYDKFLDWINKQSKNNIVLVSEYKHNIPDNAYILLEIPSRTNIRNKNGKVIETVEVLYTVNKNFNTNLLHSTNIKVIQDKNSNINEVISL